MVLIFVLLSFVVSSYSGVPLDKINSNCKETKCFVEWCNKTKGNFDDLDALPDARIPQYKVLEYIDDWFSMLSKPAMGTVIKASYPLTQEFMLRIHKKRLQKEMQEIEARIASAKDHAWIVSSLTSLFSIKNIALGIVDDLIQKVEERNIILTANGGKLNNSLIKSQRGLLLLRKVANPAVQYLYDLALLCPTDNPDPQNCYDKQLNTVILQYGDGTRGKYLQFVKDTNSGSYKFTVSQRNFLNESGIENKDNEFEDYNVLQTKDLSFLFNKIKSQSDTSLCEFFALSSLIEAEYFNENAERIDISPYYLASVYYKQFGINNQKKLSTEQVKMIWDNFVKEDKYTRSMALLANQKLFASSDYTEDIYLKNKNAAEIKADKTYEYKSYHFYNRYIDRGRYNPEKIGFKFIKRIIDSGHPIQVTLNTDKSLWYEDWFRLSLETNKDMQYSASHSVVIVGYGVGLNPETLGYEPYLIIRDSQILMPFVSHYRTSMTAIANRIVWLGLVSNVSAVK